MNKTHLYRGMENIRERDSSSLRVSMYDCYLKNNRIARYVDGFCNKYKNSSIASILYTFWFLLNYSKQVIKGNDSNILSTYEYSNEFKAVEKFCSDYGLENVGLLTRESISLSPILKLIKKLSFCNTLRFYRILRLLKSRYNFLIVCRVLEFLSYYFFIEVMLDKKKPRVIISSSDVNPNGVSILAYSEKYSLKTIFFNHGLVTKPLPRLNYTLSVLECHANAHVYGVKDFSDDRIFLANGNSVITINELSKNCLNVGIFLSTFPNVEEVATKARELQEKGFKISFIRPHPNQLTIKNSDLAFLRNSFPETTVDNDKSVKSNLERVYFTIGGNTSAHVDSLKAGIPSVYFDCFDSDPADLFGFLEYGLLPNGESISLDSIIDNINTFYQSDEWLKAGALYGVYKNTNYDGLDLLVRKIIDS